MRQFLIALAFVALTAPVFGDVSSCYYGWTQSEDVDPEEDWATTFGNANDDLGSTGASCVGPYAACFKARWEGDDDFLSVYGCVDDVFSPTTEESAIPEGFTVDDLFLKRLPDKDGECEDEDETLSVPDLTGVVTDPAIASLDGEITGSWCTCMEADCNSAAKSSVAVVAFISAIVAMAL